jgi:hypothetical protein
MADKSKELMSLTKSEKDEAGKNQNHVIKETPTHFTVKVAAFTDKGKTFVGWSQVVVVKVNEAGLKAAREALTLSDIIDLNRQKITDVRNNIARLGDIQKAVAKVREGKATPEEFKAVMAVGLKGGLGEAIQTELTSLITKALASK